MPAHDVTAQLDPVKLQHVMLSNVSSCIPDNTWTCLQHVLAPHLLTLTHLSFKEVTGVKGLRQHTTDLEKLQELHVSTHCAGMLQLPMLQSSRGTHHNQHAQQTHHAAAADLQRNTS